MHSAVIWLLCWRYVGFLFSYSSWFVSSMLHLKSIKIAFYKKYMLANQWDENDNKQRGKKYLGAITIFWSIWRNYLWPHVLGPLPPISQPNCQEAIIKNIEAPIVRAKHPNQFLHIRFRWIDSSTLPTILVSFLTQWPPSTYASISIQPPSPLSTRPIQAPNRTAIAHLRGSMLQEEGASSGRSLQTGTRRSGPPSAMVLGRAPSTAVWTRCSLCKNIVPRSGCCRGARC